MEKLKVVCVCGWETSGSEDEVVASTQSHGRDLHNMDTTREQVMQMAAPAGDEKPS